MRFAHVAAALSRWNFYPHSFQQRSTTSASKFTKYCEKLAPGFTFVFFHLVWFVSSPSLHGQDATTDIPNSQVADDSGSVWKKLGLPEPNPNAPYANPPKLEPLFDDDFATDSRNNYEIGGKEGAVTWEPGKLTLSDGAKLSHELGADNWVELCFDLQFPELTEDGQKSELKIFLDLAPANDSYLVLRQMNVRGQTISRILFYDTQINMQGPADYSGPKAIREYRFDEPLPDGSWRIEFRNGLWKLVGPALKESDLVAFFDIEHSLVQGFRVSASGKPIATKKLAVRRNQLHDIEFDAIWANQTAKAVDLNYKVVELWQKGRSLEALPIAQEAAAIWLQTYGRFHGDFAMFLHNLAMQYSATGNKEKAAAAYDLLIESLQWTELNPGLARSMNNLAVIRVDNGQESSAIELLESALGINRAVFLEDHPAVLANMNNLAMAYHDIGRDADARALLEQTVSVARRVYRDDPAKYASILLNLSTVCQALDCYQESQKACDEALEINKRIFGANSPEYSRSLGQSAQILDALGKAAEAEALCRESIRTFEELPDSSLLDLSTSIEILASIQNSLGRTSEAIYHYREALRINRQALPDGDDRIATSLNNLGVALIDAGRPGEAIPILTEALSQRVQRFGSDHVKSGQALQNLAFAEFEMGDANSAERNYRNGLGVYRKHSETNPGGLKTCLDGLGRVLVSLERYQEAEQVLEESLEICRSQFPENGHRLAISLATLGIAKMQQRRLQEAVGDFREAMNLVETQRSQTRGGFRDRSLISERIKLLPLSRAYARCLIALDTPEEAFRVLELGSCRSGLELIASGRKSAESAIRASSDNTRIMRLDAAIRLEAESRTKLERLKASILGASIEDKKEILAEIAREQIRLSQFENAVFDVIDGDLPQVTPYDLDAIVAGVGEKHEILMWSWSEFHVAAIVVDKSGVTSFVVADEKGQVSALAKKLAELRSALSTNPNGGTTTQVQQSIETLRDILFPKALCERLVNSRSVIVVPDGQMADVPMELFFQNVSFSYSPSASIAINRLDAVEARMESRARIVILGNPEFHDIAEPGEPSEKVLASYDSARLSALEQIQFYGGSLLRLPGTGVETNSIGRLFGPHSVKLLGAEATSARLRSALEPEPPRVLHLATHGLTGSKDHPLHTSFALTSPVRPVPGDTGFLTLEEILSTWPNKLRGTELVVLSACSSARGVQQGDTCMSMPLGLFVCGAETVIASQWKVDDIATALLMSRFYANWLGKTESEREIDGVTYPPGQSLSKLAALREAQAWLRGLTRVQVESITKSLADPATDGATAITQFTRGGDDELKTPLDLEYPYAHPYYWSSFVLYGSPE